MTDPQPELIYYRANRKPAICSICCAQVGEPHEDYCHGTGVVTLPEAASR